MRILMYHDIVRGLPQEAHSVSVGQFAAQIRWLKEAGYLVTTVEEWHSMRSAGVALPKSLVALTFDDGYEDNYTLAWPILRYHGYPATVFLTAGTINKTSAWRQGELAHARMLSTEQIHQMAREGASFGSHTVSHPRLTQLSTRGEVDRELVESKAVLEELVGKPVVAFCYPYSDVNREVRRRVRAAGYRLALTYVPDYVGAPGNDELQLNRIGILATDSLQSFAQKVRSTPRLRLRRYMRRAKATVRRVIDVQ